MAAEEHQVTLEELRALARAAGLHLTDQQLQQVREELADLLPRLQRLEEAPVQEAEPDWLRPSPPAHPPA